MVTCSPFCPSWCSISWRKASRYGSHSSMILPVVRLHWLNMSSLELHWLAGSPLCWVLFWSAIYSEKGWSDSAGSKIIIPRAFIDSDVADTTEFNVLIRLVLGSWWSLIMRASRASGQLIRKVVEDLFFFEVIMVGEPISMVSCRLGLWKWEHVYDSCTVSWTLIWT